MPKRERVLAAPSGDSKKQPLRCRILECSVPVAKRMAKKVAALDENGVKRFLLKTYPKVPVKLEELAANGAAPVGGGTGAAGDASSDGTTSEEERLKTTTDGQRKERNLQARKRRRVRLYQHLASQLPMGTSLLEQLSVGADTLKYYKQEVGIFLQWSQRQGLSTSTTADVDNAMAMWMSEMFLRGICSWRAERCMAGLLCLRPVLNTQGMRSLPRCYRALRGFRRLSPGRSRCPAPWAVWCGMAVWMAERGHVLMGMATLLGVTCFLRPSEMMGIRRVGLQRPSSSICAHWCLLLFPEEFEERSKTRSADDSIPIDTSEVQWMKGVLEQLSRGQTEETIWPFSYAEYVDVFRRAAEDLRVSPLVPY